MTQNKTIDVLARIERESPVQTIKVFSKEYWPLFRVFVYNQLLKGQILVFGKDKRSILQKFLNVTTGFFYWFRKYDYAVFSNELELKKIDGLAVDKLAEGFMTEVGYDRSLYIEQVHVSHSRQAKSRKRVSSFDLVIVIAGFYKLLFKPGYKAVIEGENCYKQILETNNLIDNYRDGLDTFLSKVWALKWLLKALRVKYVVITDYGNLAITYAAHELNLQVIEFQHGVIGREHPYYHPSIKLNHQFIPDYLLTFGLNDVNALEHNNYVSHNNVVPIGNFYLDMLSIKEPNHAIQELVSGWHRTICIPTDSVTHEYLLNFVIAVAGELPDHLFIISQRKASLVSNTSPLPPNVKAISEFSYQDLIRHCDFNSSTNSTCALEALALGAQNILIDEDGLASQFFGKLLTNIDETRFSKTKLEYIKDVRSMPRKTRAQIKEANYGSYVTNHSTRLKNFIKKLEQKN